jgi:hypothetical protein
MGALLRSCPVKRGDPRPYLAKIMTPDKVYDFGDVYRYDMTPLDFQSFDDMAAILDVLKDDPERCVIRGDVIKAGPCQRRLLRDQADGGKATIVPSPGQHWIMLDIDKRPAEGDLHTNEDRLEFLISTLPPEFHDATYFYKWSSKAGRDGWDYLSCHFWFWMDEAQTCANLHKRSSRGGDWYCKVDPAVFTPNQIHYTSSPLFAEVEDPCAGFRSGIVRKSLDAAPVKAWVEPYQPRAVYTAKQREERSPGKQTTELLDEIGFPYYHEAIRKVLAHYISVVPRTLWNEDWLFAEVKNRAMGSGRGYLAAGEIDDYLRRLWDGAVFKFWNADR